MSVRYLAGAAAAIWVMVGFPDARTGGAATAPPAAWRFRLGALDLTALRDGRYVTPNDGGDFGSKAGPAAAGRLPGGARAGAGPDGPARRPLRHPQRRRRLRIEGRPGGGGPAAGRRRSGCRPDHPGRRR